MGSILGEGDEAAGPAPASAVGSGGTTAVETGIPARLLLERGTLKQYLEDHPQSARRVQEEMMQVSILGGGDEAAGPAPASAVGSGGTTAVETGIPARLLLERGTLKRYLEDHPQSARRVQEEMMQVSILGGGDEAAGPASASAVGS